MKKSILILTALTGIVTGAFAGGPPTPITQLPALIDQPGKYVLDPSAVAQPDVYTQQPAIQISASNVDLDLNGLQIDCFWGIQVGIGATVDAACMTSLQSEISLGARMRLRPKT